MRRLTYCFLVLLFTASPLAAQKYEVHPYAGGFFPGKFVTLFEGKKEGIYGIKGGVFLNRRVEVGGNFGYISDLTFEDTLTRKRAYIFEGNVAVHTSGAYKLFAAFGMGGVATTVVPDSNFFFDPSLLTRDHFFSVSYGGGMKALQRWGPVGFRADVKGRSMPHYYGFRFSWLETTGGLTFSWGER